MAVGNAGCDITDRRLHYSFFALTVSSSRPFPGLIPVEPTGRYPRVSVDFAPRAELERRFSGPTGRRVILASGAHETIEIMFGEGQDVWLNYEQRARFHISPGGGHVLCAPTDPAAADWQRVLLDTVLGTAALCRGHEAVHAAAAELPGGIVAITAGSGGGKTTLCAELMRRGGRLFADDLVFLTRESEGVIAHPGPPLMNLPLGLELDAHRLGERVAVFDDEEWVAIAGAATTAARLRAVIVLERDPAIHGAWLERASPLSVIAAGLDSGSTLGRRRARFELLGDLAGQATVMTLRAGPEVLPETLAELVESVVERGVPV
jgi:hypothetical protein